MPEILASFENLWDSMGMSAHQNGRTSSISSARHPGIALKVGIQVSIILSGLFSSLNPAHADFYVHHWDNFHSTKPDISLDLRQTYYSTSANFDGLGNPFAPTGFLNYTRIITDLTFLYSPTKAITLFARGTWSFIQINSSVRPGSGFGFGDQTAGANYRVYESRTKKNGQPVLFFDLQAQADIPAYNSADAELKLTPYLGDGSFDFTGGVFAGVSILHTRSATLRAMGGGGYTYRTSNFSQAIPWTALLQFMPKDSGFYASLGVSGVTSLKSDPNITLIRPNLGAGGSFAIGGTNPSLMTARGSLGYQFDKNKILSLGGSQAFWGQAAPQGFSVTANFWMHLEDDETNRREYDDEYERPYKINSKSRNPRNSESSTSGTNYSLVASVLKSNERLNLVKIDKGSQDGVEVGQLFDLFSGRQDGSSSPIARAEVTHLRSDEAALKIVEFFKEVVVQEGFVAKQIQ